MNCALFYKGEDVSVENAGDAIDEPSDLEFEFIVLSVYKQALLFLDKGNPGRFNESVMPDPVLNMSSKETTRKSFIEIYKNEQTKILKA